MANHCIRDRELYFNSNERLFPLAIQARDGEKPEGTLVAIAGGMDVPLLITAMHNPQTARFVDADKRQLNFDEIKYRLACRDFSAYRKIFLGFQPLDEAELRKLFPEEDAEFLSKLHLDGEKMSPISYREGYGNVFNWFGNSPIKEAGDYAGLRNWGRFVLNSRRRDVSFDNVNLFDSGAISGKSPLTVYVSNILEYFSQRDLDKLESLTRACDADAIFYDTSRTDKVRLHNHLRRFSRDGFIDRIKSKAGLTPDLNEGQT